MKKQTFMAFAAVLILAACTGNKELEIVTHFANDFATKVSENQVDSVHTLYPDAAICDSFAAQFTAENIVVQETGKVGFYKVSLGEGVDFTLEKNAEGKMKIVKSHGLFAYPEKDMDMAKNVGMWEAELTDVQFAERIRDKGFQDFLVEKTIAELTKKIEANDVSYEWNQNTWDGIKAVDKVFVTLKNNSDYNLNKSDYKISSYWQYNNADHFDAYIESQSLKAGESKKVEAGLDYFPYITENDIKSGKCRLTITSNISLNLSKEEIMNRFFKPTGSEWGEYSNGKKEEKTIFN